MTKTIFENSIKKSIQLKNNILKDNEILKSVESIVDEIVKTFNSGGKVFFCGNGGSAADAQHLAAELSGRFYIDRPALYAEALHVNTSYITAISNDYGYDIIYSRLIEGFTKKGDILIGISTSGNSKNVVNALIKAKELDVLTISLTGNNGGKMKEISDYNINIPTTETPRIQECHILLGHIICQLVESKMFSL